MCCYLKKHLKLLQLVSLIVFLHQCVSSFCPACALPPQYAFIKPVLNATIRKLANSAKHETQWFYKQLPLRQGLLLYSAELSCLAPSSMPILSTILVVAYFKNFRQKMSMPLVLAAWNLLKTEQIGKKHFLNSLLRKKVSPAYSVSESVKINLGRSVAGKFSLENIFQSVPVELLRKSTCE